MALSTDRMEMAGRLKSARERLYPTRMAFCRAGGINPRTYHCHENGSRRLNPRNASVYAELLGVKTVWLLYGDEDQPMPAAKLSWRDYMPWLREEFGIEIHPGPNVGTIRFVLPSSVTLSLDEARGFLHAMTEEIDKADEALEAAYEHGVGETP